MKILNDKLLLEECDTCSGKFLRLTQDKNDNIPTKFCEACGRELKPEAPNVVKYDKNTGNVISYSVVLCCKLWAPPKKVYYWYGAVKKNRYNEPMTKETNHTRLSYICRDGQWEEH